jgi:ABC-type sugar transport system permease subunit
MQLDSGGAPAPPESNRSSSGSLPSLLIRLGALAVIDAFGIWLVYELLLDGVWPFSIALIVVLVLLNVVFLTDRFPAYRWISPGLALMILFVAFPVLFTVYISFTNYGDGHLLTKQQTIDLYENLPPVLPADAELFQYTVFQNADGDLMLWLQPTTGGEPFTVLPGGDPVPRSGDVPESLEGFQRLNPFRAAALENQLRSTVFGTEEDSFQVHPSFPGQAGKFEPAFIYDAEQDALIENATDRVFRPILGTYTAEDGTRLTRGGYADIIGFSNYTRLFTDPGLRQPFIRVFLWTIAFAAFSVALTFSLGLFLAIMFDVPEMPFRRLLRSLLLIPYAIPAFVSVPVWVGLLNPQFGVISQAIQGFTSTFFFWIPAVGASGWVPAWFADPFWAKVGILLIQVWLGAPYMFVIVTGALQTLPKDVYEASAIDGASAWQAFRSITLPLLLITVGPLLVASFAFNFNNFTVIDLYNSGGPPMRGTASPVGHTDILATYTYRIAFQSGRGADQGYAAAITVIIFLILLIITALQFRYTNMLEERSENV